MINFSNIKENFKQEQVRKTFKVGEHIVEVYNADLSKTEELFDIVINFFNGEEEKFEIKTKEAIKVIYTIFTNIDIDGDDIFEALENPNFLLQEIQREITYSLTDVIKNYLKEKEAEINNLELIIASQDLKSKGNNILKKAGIK